MKINEIIREKRIARGMTQEQMAAYLGVSAPAVNKWEKAVSYPDITLLPALARLLETDLNTLLSFKEDLTDEEIGAFTGEICMVAMEEGRGIADAFALAEEKIREYPSCDKLVLNAALALEGVVLLTARAGMQEQYLPKIEEMYKRAANSKDAAVKYHAKSMLVSKHKERGEYEEAERLLEELPDETLYDKKMIDHMRQSFLEIREREAQMVQKNQRIVTEMSHDLRTPVTSIILYTEILKKGKNLDEAQQKKYMDIIEKKAYRMKQLTDHLFEYSLTAGSEEIQLEEPEAFEIIFYDIFSETCSYLEQKGFQVDFQVEWSDEKIRISEDYVMRIMDNITSNLLKYADAAFPLILSSVREENFIGFSVENHVRRDTGRTESTGIGIQNIKNMMEKMHGKCGTERKGESFRLTLLFPVI